MATAYFSRAYASNSMLLWMEGMSTMKITVAVMLAPVFARPPRFYRTEGRDAMIFGVAGGLAEYFDIDPTLVRAVWAMTALVGGVGILLYVLLWIIAPTKSEVMTGVSHTYALEQA
jgi:phage shock protein C